MWLNCITLGLIFSLVTIGTWLTSRVIAFDDLSIEGSFCLGGAFTAQLLLHGVAPWVTIPLALAAGAGVGMLTTILHNALRINNLLCGILVTNIMFSTSLLLASANVSLLNTATLFNCASIVPKTWWLVILPGIIVLCALALVHWLLTTEIGLLIQTLGTNRQLVVSLGKRPALFEGIALGLANALSALAGSLFVQLTGFFSIWSSVGVMIVSLAGLMLGQLIHKKLPALVLGSITLQLLIALAFEINIQPELHKLISAVLVITFTIISHIRRSPC